MKEKIEIIGNETNQSQSEFYTRFKKQLNEAYSFPTKYIYKFIVPAEMGTIAMVHAIFENTGATFATRDSKTGKYTSLTVTMPAQNADTVISYYQEVATLKGVVMM